MEPLPTYLPSHNNMVAVFTFFRSARSADLGQAGNMAFMTRGIVNSRNEWLKPDIGLDLNMVVVAGPHALGKIRLIFDMPALKVSLVADRPTFRIQGD
ncbi:hypothetical protein N7493_000586 [Penicillium malachiteum]|uniref:Uncharacterized protein n=1 Tax=Penicillium malachiteum TaxID=1324776 RepID=A0AAD6HXP0_9EURO|nr:hypothetical protein N7493_000586 [Penicillium malachiteum]